MSGTNLSSFTDVLGDEIPDSQPLSLPSTVSPSPNHMTYVSPSHNENREKPAKRTGQLGNFRSVEEVETKYRSVFTYPFFNLVQSSVIEDALYSDRSMVVCAPTGSGKTVIFEMAIVQLLMKIEEKKCTGDFKIIYMAPVKALCTERLTEWYSKFTKLGVLCIEVTGDTNVDLNQLHAYKIIITTPEKWDMLTRRWRDHRGLVEMIKLFLIDEVHILNDDVRGPVLEAVVSRMKTIELSAQSAHRIEKLKKQYKNIDDFSCSPMSSLNDDFAPKIRFVAVSATVGNPEDVASWLGSEGEPAVFYKFGDECRPVKLKRVVEGYPCQDGTSIFKFDIILSYKLWPIIQKYYDGKPTLIFCNTRKSVELTAETLSREITITFNPDQKAKLTSLASTVKNKKLQMLLLSGVGCHHAGMLYEERVNIEMAFRNRDLPILITTTTLAMGVNLPAHLVIIKNTQQYVNGAYQEYSISTVLQMVGRAGRPQFDTEATAVIMTRQRDKARYQALVGGSEPLQSYLHKRLAENLNSEAALGTVVDVAQCVQWLRSTFLYVRAAKDPKRYLGLPSAAPSHQISKKIEEMCVRAMNGLASAGLITMDEASCIEATEAGRLMSFYYLDLETMKLIMKIQGNESLERMLTIICECHELADMHLRVDERRCLNALNRNNTSATIRFPMKGKITSRQMKLNCIIQAILGCLPIPDPSLNQEAMKVMRIAERICKCLVAFVTRPELISKESFFSAILNSIILAKCIVAHLWENSPFMSRQLRGIGPTFSTLLASAGKVNFILIEESHPRDLERIMNKGPPAGNLLRKQISLLPKYQLTANPVDEKTVSVELLLLNKAYLSENMENLNAGTTHKCYIIVGDSKNHVLLFSTFKDNDLISVFNGTMKLEIIRKHDFEHKIFVKCISSTFVGIDVQCEYTFKNLLRLSYSTNINPTVDPVTENNIMQNHLSASTSYPKGRKRKLTEEIAQSKEKKKRELALAEKCRLLKETFARRSNEIKQDLQQSMNQSKIVLNELNEIDSAKSRNEPLLSDEIKDWESLDEVSDSETFNNLLQDIEKEIISNDTISKPNNKKKVARKVINKHTAAVGSNYKFLELLDKNVELSDDDVDSYKNDGFTESIKKHVAKYLENSRYPRQTIDLTLSKLCPETEGQYNINELQPKSEISISNGIEDCTMRNHDIATITHIARAAEMDERNEQKHDQNNILLYKKNKSTALHSPLLRISDISNEEANTVNLDLICSGTQNNIFNKSKNALLSNRFDLVSNTKDKYGTYAITKNTNIGIDNSEGINEKVLLKNRDQMCVRYENDKINRSELTPPMPLFSEHIANIQNVSLYEQKDVIVNRKLHNVASGVLVENVNKKNNLLSARGSKLCQNAYEEELTCPVINTNKNAANNYISKDFNPNIYLEADKRSLRTYSTSNNKKENYTGNSSPSPNESYSNQYNVAFEKKDSRYNTKVSTMKYIFTAEKVDIHTKSENLHVHVVKKIKIDLDVTEIICDKRVGNSKSDNSLDSEALDDVTNVTSNDTLIETNSDDKPTYKDCSVIKYGRNKSVLDVDNSKSETSSDSVVLLGSTNSNIKYRTNETKNLYDSNYKDFSVIKFVQNNSFKQNNEEHSVFSNDMKTIIDCASIENDCIQNKNLKDTTQLENEHCTNQNVSIQEENSNIDSKDQMLENTSTQNNQNKKGYNIYNNDMKTIVDNASIKNENIPNKNIQDTTHLESNRDIKKYPRDVNIQRENRTIENKQQKVENTTIQKILAKYGSRVRQNKNCELMTNYQIKKTKKDNDIKQKTLISPKPFTITAIDHLNLNLDLLCDPVTSNNACQGSHSQESELETVAHLNSTPGVNHPTEYTKCSINNTTTCSGIVDDYDCTSYLSPKKMYDLSQIDINVDNNMLDPKAIIQCYNADEDTNIIPPPVEFSDNRCNTYSPKASENYINLRSQCSQFSQIDSLDTPLLATPTIDCSYIDLTPSKEIKTWTVTNEECYGHNHFAIGSKKSPSKFIRYNHNDNSCTIPDTILSGRRLLSQFKFNSKDKYRSQYKLQFLKRR